MRQYAAFLKSILARDTAESFFPLEFPVGQPPKDYIALRDAVVSLINGSKERAGSGYSLIIEQQNKRQYGNQSIPKRVVFETETDYLSFLQKQAEVSRFRADVDLIESGVPALSDWIARSPLKVIDNHGKWPELIKVCQYFEKNPQPRLYIRELPIAVHTKFVEENKKILRTLLEEILPGDCLQDASEVGDRHIFEARFSLRFEEPFIRIRLLDEALRKRYGVLFSYFSLPISSLAQLDVGHPQCFITENLMSFLTLPPIDDAIALFGAGKAVSLLKKATWLTHCPIYYWGDMDVDGFRILSSVRSHFPQTQSILMDSATYEKFASFAVDVAIRETDGLDYLNEEERSLCDRLIAQKKRLEQERIDQFYVNQTLQGLLS